MALRKRSFSAPLMIVACHGWLLHHDAVRWAARAIRSITARGTGSGLNARQEYRAASRLSSTSMASAPLADAEALPCA